MQLSEIEKFQLLVIDDASFKQAVQQAATVCPRPLWTWPFDLEGGVWVSWLL